MQDYYCLLTHGFKTEKCFTAKEPFEKIENQKIPLQRLWKFL